MKEYITFLLQNIVDNPDDIKVEETKQDSYITISISANPDDMGKIIGKHGKTISAIKDLARAKAIRDNVKVTVYLQEDIDNQNA